MLTVFCLLASMLIPQGPPTIDRPRFLTNFLRQSTTSPEPARTLEHRPPIFAQALFSLTSFTSILISAEVSVSMASF